jgi:hypothetical protein
LNSGKDNFQIDENTCSTPKALFFNTGEMKKNPELKELEKEEVIDGITADNPLNDFVVTEPSQVRIRYAVLCEFFK